MAKITRKTAYLPTVEQIFSLWLSDSAAKGLTDKTLETYRSHFQAIGKRLDTSLPIAELTTGILNGMILQMRQENLSDCSISSYTRTVIPRTARRRSFRYVHR